MDEYLEKPKFEIMSAEERRRFWQIVDTNLWPVEGVVIIDLLMADSSEAFHAGGNHAMQFVFGLSQIEKLQVALHSAKEMIDRQSLGPRLVTSNTQASR